MRISEKLKKAGEFNPTKKSHQMTVFEMCDKIKANKISLPLYQRDLSWNLQKSVELLNYQLFGKAPVSPISLNIIEDVIVPQVSFIDREILIDISSGQQSVVDGQQRLSTNFKAFSNHEDFRNIVLDIGRAKFISVEGAIRNSQIPVGFLLNEKDEEFFNYINDIPLLKKNEVYSALLQIRSKIKNYNYTINIAENLTEDEQIEWFEVLNNAGSRVSALEMRFSKLKFHGIDIYVQYTHKYKDKLSESGYDHLFSPHSTGVSYPVATLNPSYEVVMNRVHSNNYAPIPSDTKENQLCNLAPENIELCFSITLNALDSAINFIKDNDLKEPSRIDYINYLTGLYVFNTDTFDELDSEALIDWYNNVDFTNKSNSERREMFSDLLNIRTLVS
ncbi:DUF262 domain-containing protein [Listeria portnoyi]|uniref:DUF262 domain-containing protein n=1 Tax=Listeria portnoyi TaxID=2713504 RepID=UPI001C9CE505|nr:DUF262 domain-containing protein [Listeria portnoyi]